MIPTRQVPLALATASRRGTVLMHRCQLQHQTLSASPTAAASPRSRSTNKPPPVGHDPDKELLQLEDEYSTLKVNWFPGHMVKATKIIREKLKQVCATPYSRSRCSWGPRCSCRIGMHAYPKQYRLRLPPRHACFSLHCAPAFFG